MAQFLSGESAVLPLDPSESIVDSENRSARFVVVAHPDTLADVEMAMHKRQMFGLEEHGLIVPVDIDANAKIMVQFVPTNSPFHYL